MPLPVETVLSASGGGQLGPSKGIDVPQEPLLSGSDEVRGSLSLSPDREEEEAWSAEVVKHMHKRNSKPKPNARYTRRLGVMWQGL